MGPTQPIEKGRTFLKLNKNILPEKSKLPKVIKTKKLLFLFLLPTSILENNSKAKP
jgi:hypothetical protein